MKATYAAMFTHSNIAKMMTLNRTKSMYAINHDLALFFKSALISDLQKSDIHTHINSFDKSLNQVTQTCKMDLYLCYRDVKENLVQSRYYE